MPSFDVVSEIDSHELTNAVDQASRELSQRFDFKNTGARFELEETTVTMFAPSEFQLNQMLEILKLKVAKRGIDVVCLDVQEPLVNLAVAKQLVILKHGIDQDTGKKVTRLSLLSGGEKALTAVAMLVAIFRARPSPFYIMDEVEAALDDTNLRRLLSLFELLRARSQLLIITHQKPTMEVADALYGVTMQGDGITAVISQRMRGQQVEQLVGNPS